MGIGPSPAPVPALSESEQRSDCYRIRIYHPESMPGVFKNPSPSHTKYRPAARPVVCNLLLERFNSLNCLGHGSCRQADSAAKGRQEGGQRTLGIGSKSRSKRHLPHNAGRSLDSLVNCIWSPVKYPIIAILSLAALSACTPDAYKQSADSQVHRIIEDRKKSTLDYSPSTTLPAEDVPTKPTKAAYRLIPVSPIPPVTPVGISMDLSRLPKSRLGPEMPMGMPDKEIEADQFGLAAAQKQISGRTQLGPASPGDLITRVDLFQAIHYSAYHSREYKSRLEDLYLAALDVTLQRHLFEPRAFAQSGFGIQTTRDADLHLAAATTATQSIGIRQQLPYGGEIVAQGLVGFVNALDQNIDSGESASVALTASVPLLRGAGMVNLEPLIQSERSIIYELRKFETYRRSMVVDIATRYFNLVNQQQGLSNREHNYQNLIVLTRRTQALYEAGRINFQEVQRSGQAELNAETRLLDSQESYQTAVDNFKLLIGMPLNEPLEIIPVELQVTSPDATSDQAVQLAYRYRLDLETARDQVADAQREVEVSRNGLLPDANLYGSVGVTNPDGTPARGVNSDTTTYSAGVNIDWPLDRVAERNTYRRSLIMLQRANREMEGKRDQIANDSRDALRGIRLAELQIAIQYNGIELARRRVEYANELLKDGRASARDVVDAQSSLLDTQDRYDQARAELQIAILEYLQATGTLRLDPDSGALGQAMN